MMKENLEPITPAQAKVDSVGKLARKRLESFAALFARAMIDDDAKTVHDLRVASRRLQQLLRGLPAANAKKNSKKVSSFLRGVRQALGPLRNLDVMAAMTAARASEGGSEATRAAWTEIKEGIEKQRGEESSRARQALKHYDLTGFLDRISRSMSRLSAETVDDELQGVVGGRFQVWSDALNAVVDDPTANRLHALRIAGKRLRYAVELQAALSDPKAKTLAHSLAKLQDNLGAWHDVHTLLQYVGAYLNQQEFLAEHPGKSRALLLEMERERKRGQLQAEEAVAAAEKLRDTWPSPQSEKIDN
jgi:CHAD domain-containing protein